MKQKAGKQVCVMGWDLIIPIVTVFTSLKTLLELICIALHCQELGGVLVKTKSKDCSIRAGGPRDLTGTGATSVVRPALTTSPLVSFRLNVCFKAGRTGGTTFII